ncbi:MAG: ytxJ [Fibrobacteres bacterium]|nr:ytxJ [Fibrobacterota bacterium]
MQHITNESEAVTAVSASAGKPVIIYKHSAICGMCDIAIVEFERFRERESDRFAFYQVDVIGARKASQKIEALMQVRHESPQVLMIWDSRCLWHGSHRAIKEDRLRTEAEAFLLGLPGRS